jgi:hypothetical protein
MHPIPSPIAGLALFLTSTLVNFVHSQLLTSGVSFYDNRSFLTLPRLHLRRR